jgi:hypothetical protein
MQCTSCPNPWEYCEGNVCVSGVLTVDAPLNGDIVDAGASFTLGATLRRDGGASLGFPVPYEFPGKMSSVVSGTPAQDTAPTVPQRMAVRFGWPAPGPNETRAVDVIGCLASVSQACAPFEGCLASTDGGACVRAFQQLEWASPSDDSLVRSEQATFTSFGPVIRLMGLRAGVSPPAQVPVFAEDAGFTATATIVSMAGGTASYGTPSVTMSRTTFGPDGPKVFVAGWTGGGAMTSARRVVTLDTQAPVVTVTGEPRTGGLPGGDPANPGFWVKDEVARVRVEVTGVSGAPVAGDVVVDGGIVETTAGANCTACTSSGCICATVDLKGVRFAGLTGQVSVQVPAGRFVDAVGNESVAASGSLAVTRVRWARQLALPTGTSFVAAPAVDRDGTLFVGSSNTMNWTGTVFALHPVDGGVLWQNGSLGAVQALATARTATETAGQQNVLFVTSNVSANGGRLQGLLVDGGTDGLPSGVCSSGSRPMYSAPALVLLSGAQDGGTAQVGALGVFNTQGATLGSTCGYSPALPGPAFGPSASEYALPLVPLPAPSPVNLVASGSAVFNVNSNFTIQPWAWTTNLTQTTPNLTRMFPSLQTGMSLIPSGTPNQPLVVTTQTRNSPTEPVGAAAPGLGSFISAPANSANDGFTRSSPVVALPATGPNFWLVGGGSGNLGLGTAIGDWLRLTQLTVGSTPSLMTPTSPSGPASGGPEELLTSPVLGDASELYAVTRQGRLYVMATSQSGVTRGWFAPLPGAGFDVVAHPTLDCNRTRPGTPGMPGVLYSVSTQGLVSAILVDSARLAPASPWPKWQRSASNAGNLDDANFPLNPGCP